MHHGEDAKTSKQESGVRVASDQGGDVRVVIIDVRFASTDIDLSRFSVDVGVPYEGTRIVVSTFCSLLHARLGMTMSLCLLSNLVRQLGHSRGRMSFRRISLLSSNTSDVPSSFAGSLMAG